MRASAKRILVVDEGRFSAGIGEGVITAITEAGLGGKPGRRVVRRRYLHAAGGRCVPGDPEGRGHRGRG
jgi:hypothetical protein